MNIASRRLKLLSISEEMLLECLTLFNGSDTEKLLVPITVENKLPPDARVVAVNHDYRCKSLVLTIASDSFPEVVPGDMIPPTDYPWLKMVQVIRRVDPDADAGLPKATGWYYFKHTPTSEWEVNRVTMTDDGRLVNSEFGYTGDVSNWPDSWGGRVAMPGDFEQPMVVEVPQ